MLRDAPRFVEESAHERTLPVVNVTDDGQVLVGFVFAHCCSSRAKALISVSFARCG
ncbi:hypothetical protein C492_02632 [Natronococcus jeotgali DSM 18795]|uniref:Uncharacterized protein n=1 Tax=Natronococcus jeotgali DSM 18795 TaxID=1227498 RepID=L9XVQ0_9EURY|nr:hypothetical protein C492_02632 [Natronococcus jeotgali DSM 18795]